MTDHAAASEFWQIEESHLSPPNIATRHLRVFIAIYQQRSVTDAADMLLLSQPTVSRALKAFETRLGHSLFTRTRTGVTPTEAAEALYPHALAAIEAIDAGIAAAGGVPAPSALNVGTVPELLTRYGRAIRHLAAIDRDIARFETGGADRLIAGLRKGTYDIVAVPATGDQVMDLPYCEQVDTIRVALHRPAGDLRADLLAIPPEGSWERHLLRSLLGRDPAGPMFEVSGGGLAKRFLTEGFSTYLPVCCAQDLDDVTVVDPLYEVPVYVVANRPIQPGTAAGRFADRLRESGDPGL